MPYDRPEDERDGLNVTPMGMPSNYGQTHQSASGGVGRGRQGPRPPKPSVRGAILNNQSGVGYSVDQQGPLRPKPSGVRGPNSGVGAGGGPEKTGLNVGQTPLYSAPGVGGGAPKGGVNGTMPVGNPVVESIIGGAGAGLGAGGAARQGFGGMNLGFGGNVNPMGFSGFNLDRAFAGGDPNSVKDGFARTVAGLNVDVRGLDKAQVGEVLASQVIPALNANGIQARIQPGSYDVIEAYTNERGWEPIDVVKNAGSADAEWAWQDLMGGGGAQSGPQGPMVANDIYANAQTSILNPVDPNMPQDGNALLALLEQLFAQSGQPNFSTVPDYGDYSGGGLI
jgi:hypothetical protein